MSRLMLRFEVVNRTDLGWVMEQAIKAMASHDPEPFEIEFPGFGPAIQGKLVTVEVDHDD